MIDGREIFKLMDSSGMPLWMIRDMLKERGEAFDVREFVMAARDSGNYQKRERLVSMLMDGVSDERCADLIRFTVDTVYDGVVMTYANPEVVA